MLKILKIVLKIDIFLHFVQYGVGVCTYPLFILIDNRHTKTKYKDKRRIILVQNKITLLFISGQMAL